MIVVTCAIIEKDGKILCAQRSETMPLPLKWEFPGGKAEEGENPYDCLKREIREELGIEIEIIRRLPSVEYAYKGQDSLKLIPFCCSYPGGEINPKEHRQIIWLEKQELLDLDWAEADIPVVDYYLGVT